MTNSTGYQSPNVFNSNYVSTSTKSSPVLHLNTSAIAYHSTNLPALFVLHKTQLDYKSRVQIIVFLPIVLE